jgi:hypothetical protein
MITESIVVRQQANRGPGDSSPARRRIHVSRYNRDMIEPLEVRRLLADTVFAIVGDYGEAGQPEADVATQVKSWNPEFIVTTGDNNYPDGEADTIDPNIGQYYHSFIHPYLGVYGKGADTNRFFPSLGNHDWRAPNAQPYLNYFALPGNERYYEFVRGPAHFFAVDSDVNEPDGNTSTSVQAQWLEQRLAASTAPWQVVYMHHPPFSSSSHHGSQPALQWPYRQWGADAVLAGHDHTYERIVLEGLPYFVNGLGGRNSIYEFGPPVPGSQVRFNSDFGAMRASATRTQLTFQFITRDGDVIDTHTLSKFSPPMNRPVFRVRAPNRSEPSWDDDAADLTDLLV